MTRAAYWDGPISGVARYGGVEYAYWRTDVKSLDHPNYPAHVWDLILNATTVDADGFGGVTTRKYDVEFWPTYDIFVRRNCYFRLYRSPTTGIALVNFHKYKENHFARDYVCVPRKFYWDDTVKCYT